MASGYGINGGVSRCFPFWQDLLACYVVNTADSNLEGRWKCIPQRDDYYECLHHKKEIAKTRVLREAYIRYEIENPGFSRGEGGKGGVGGVKGLGLMDKGERKDASS
ncbi:hypothetical protein BDZ91DRAFT_708670 [Kalaharituber pfeilii]|nr:hypothetical protein BDZ91DRAFT_708670 [Kalaharituber pfeilii]